MNYRLQKLYRRDENSFGTSLNYGDVALSPQFRKTSKIKQSPLLAGTK